MMDMRDVGDALPLLPVKVLDFPGTEGRPLAVQTNLFPLVIGDLDFRIGIYQISAVRHSQNTNRRPQRHGGKPEPPKGPHHVNANELFPLFLHVHEGELNNPGIRRAAIKGYPTIKPDEGDTLKVYVLPAFSPGFMSKGLMRRTTVDDRNRGKVVGSIEVQVTYLRDVNFSEQNVYNDFQELMKVGMMDSIATIFKDYGFERIRNDIYTQSQKKEIAGVIDVLMGMRCRIHTDVFSRPMLSINMTFTTCLRVNVPMLFVYAALILRIPLKEAEFDITRLKGLIMGGQNLKNFRAVVQGLEIKSPNIRDPRRYAYYRILDISEKPASAFLVDGVNLNTFFLNAGYPITLPHMNAVIIKKGPRQVYIPMEHCTVSATPQKLRYSMSLFRKEIISLTAVPPQARFNFICGVGQDLSNALETNRPKEPLLLTDLKVTLRKPVALTGRVLDEPATSFKDDRLVLAIPYAAKIIRYVYINLSRVTNPFTKELQSFVHYLYVNGLNVDWRDLIVEHHLQEELGGNPSLNALQDFLLDVVNGIIQNLADGRWDYDPRRHCVIFFITLPHSDEVGSDEFYNHTKAIITTAGYISQFIKAETMETLYVDSKKFKLMLKINAKLGGINNVPTNANVRWMNFVDTPTMFIGIDTRNSSERKQRGIVALAFSINRNATQYKFFVRRNHLTSRYSISSDDWRDIIGDVLNNLKGPLPERIFLLRAGMDEYNIAKGEALSENYELKTVLRYWFERANVKAPNITYIGHNRAHNIRFMQQDNDNSQQHGGEFDYNVPRGTVIDHTITHPSTFFLVTHQTFAGTLKPAKYFIVTDDNNIDANDLLSVMYTLCALSPRSNVPIRRPLPTAYCQLLLEHVVATTPNAFNENSRLIEVPENLSTFPYFV